MSEKKSSLKSRLLAEIKEVGILFIYLAAFLCAFATYRKLVLAEYNIGYIHYGYAIFEALILSKVIAVGRLLHIGHRFKTRPLIYPVIYKTLSFSIFIIAFSIVEHFCDGFLHHEKIQTIWDRLLSIGLYEILARALVMCSALLPLFAMEEIGGVLGEGTFFQWFFTHRPKSILPQE